MLNLDDVTFCIKTIRRPWACARLVQSINAYVSEPRILVVDDGPYFERFSVKFPEVAKPTHTINLEEIDQGVGVGRNLLIDNVETELLILLDDDHVLTDGLDLLRLRAMFLTNEEDLDLLGVPQGKDSMPFMLTPILEGRRVWMHRGQKFRRGSLVWCDMAPNAFIARAATLRERHRWDEDLKTFEHWEYFYRASRAGLRVAVDTSARVEHDRPKNPRYQKKHRSRLQFLYLGLQKHGFDSIRYHDGRVVQVPT